MKKTLLLLGLLLILAAGSWYVIQTKNDSNTFSNTEKHWNFAVEDSGEIGKISLENMSGDKVDLSFIDNQWLANDKYPVREWSMNKILAAIEKISIQYIPPKAELKKIFNDFEKNSIHVEIFNKEGIKIKGYRIGGEPIDGRGSYMIQDGTNQPYVMRVPYNEGSLRPVFQPNLLDWRDKAILRENPRSIQEISIDYPKQKNESFVLQKIGGSYSIRPFYSTTTANTGKLVEGQADEFLEQFKIVFGESLISQQELQETVKTRLPFCSLKVTRSDGSTVSVNFHAVPPAEGTLYENLQINRYYAVRSDGDLLICQFDVVKKIFWRYNSFFS
jgi:hypothetical protein